MPRASRPTRPTRRCARAAPATTRWCWSYSTPRRSATRRCSRSSGRATTPRKACARATTSAASTAPASMSASDAQRQAAEASKAAYQKVLSANRYGPITTEIVDAPPFYFAEDYHQQYLAKVPHGYCGLGGTGLSLPGRRRRQGRGLRLKRAQGGHRWPRSISKPSTTIASACRSIRRSMRAGPRHQQPIAKPPRPIWTNPTGRRSGSATISSVPVTPRRRSRSTSMAAIGSGATGRTTPSSPRSSTRPASTWLCPPTRCAPRCRSWTSSVNCRPVLPPSGGTPGSIRSLPATPPGDI